MPGTSRSWRVLVAAVLVCATATLRADPFFSATPSFSGPHPAVVRVAVPERDGASYGSGSLVAVNESSGLVLTNWHVVRDAAGPIVVYFPDGFRSVAYLLRTDRDWDLAALAIRRPNVPPVAMADQPPRPGDSLTIAGYGSGSYRAVTGQCTQYVSPGDNQPYEMIELSAPARNGDSGGPIFNSRGELAGVLFGSAFGRTTGSYCGRVRWFTASVDADFRRISAQALLAQQSRAPSAPTAAIPSGSAANDSTWPRATDAPNATTPDARMTQVSRHSAPMVPVPALGNSLPPLAPVARGANPPAAAATPASLPAPAADSSPIGDPMKTILAAIGVIALLYHAMRLLAKAVG